MCFGCLDAESVTWLVACGLYLCADRPEQGRMRKERKGGRKEGGREKITKDTKKDEEGEDEEEEDGEIHTWHMGRVVSALWEGDRLMRLAGARFRCSVQALSALYSLWIVYAISLSTRTRTREEEKP